MEKLGVFTLKIESSGITVHVAQASEQAGSSPQGPKPDIKSLTFLVVIFNQFAKRWMDPSALRP
jgi:hypothetical protein